MWSRVYKKYIPKGRAMILQKRRIFALAGSLTVCQAALLRRRNRARMQSIWTPRFRRLLPPPPPPRRFQPVVSKLRGTSSQRTQYPLIKEYTLNHSMKVLVI